MPDYNARAYDLLSVGTLISKDNLILKQLLQSSHISLIESETHSFQYDLTLTRFTTIFSLIQIFTLFSHSKITSYH